MNTDALEEARALYGKLRFQQALRLLNKMSETEEVLILKIRIFCTLADFEALKKTAARLKKLPATPQIQAALMQAEYVLQEYGDILKIREEDLLQAAEPDLPALSLVYVKALALLDTGKVYEAKTLLDRLEKIAGSRLDLDQDEQLRFYLNILMSLADACTFLELETRAEKLYLEAIRRCAGLADPIFRSLRTALFWNNLADLYEQMEQIPRAQEAYEKALEHMNASLQEEYDDAWSYACTILNAYGNFCSNAGRYDLAGELLEQSETILLSHWKEIVHPAAIQAKITFYQGLADLYQEKTEEAAARLQETYDLQRELVEQKLEKPLELARTAYYLSYLETDKEQVLLLSRSALDEFIRQEQKDPHFYLGAIADLYNQIGLNEENGVQALNDLEQADIWNRKGRKEYPEDPQFLQSILSVLLNKITVLTSQEEESERVRDILEELTALLLDGSIPESLFREYMEDILKKLEEDHWSRTLQQTGEWLPDLLKQHGYQALADQIRQRLDKVPEFH